MNDLVLHNYVFYTFIHYDKINAILLGEVSNEKAVSVFIQYLHHYPCQVLCYGTSFPFYHNMIYQDRYNILPHIMD